MYFVSFKTDKMIDNGVFILHKIHLHVRQGILAQEYSSVYYFAKNTIHYKDLRILLIKSFYISIFSLTTYVPATPLTDEPIIKPFTLSSFGTSEFLSASKAFLLSSSLFIIRIEV